MEMNEHLLGSDSQMVCAGTGFVALDLIQDRESSVDAGLATGGSCGNVLTILAFLGWTSYPIVRLGTDEAYKQITHDMMRWNVQQDYVFSDASVRTPIVLEEIYTNGSSKSSKFKLACPDCGTKYARYKSILRGQTDPINRLERLDVFYFDRVRPNTVRLAKLAKQRGAMVVLEPSGIGSRDLFIEALDYVDILKYSRERLSKVTSITDGCRIPIEIETLDNDGLRYRLKLSCERTEWIQSPIVPVDLVIDTVGAGDWCTSGIIHAIYSSRKSVRDICGRTSSEVAAAIEYGQTLASLQCRYVGARGMMYDPTMNLPAFEKTSLGRSERALVNSSLFNSVRYSKASVKHFCSICQP